MSNKQWYLHLQGETMGPLGTSVVKGMLNQKRLDLFEFIWSEGMEDWARVCSREEFSEGLPPYPEVPLPSGAPAEPKAEAPVAPAKPASAPSKAKKAAAAAPAPKPAAKVWPLRASIEGTIEIHGGGTYRLIDISESGLFAESNAPVSVGTEIKFKISSEGLGEDLEMTGVMIRKGNVRGVEGFAVEFTRVNPAHKRVLHDYLHQNMRSAE